VNAGIAGETDFDVAIVGGGPVGAAQGALLLRAGLCRAGRVLLLERDVPSRTWPVPPAQDPADLRVFAISRASERILQHAGVWSALAEQARVISPYERMHVWPASVEPRGAGSLRFDAAELAEPNLGHIIGNGALQRAALAAFEAAGGVLREESLQQLNFLADAVELVTETQTVTTRLVIGADGARSLVRRMAGLGIESQDYGQLAIVANLTCQGGHENTAWQRFLGEGTLALLPLASGECSLVWSLPRSKAEGLLAGSVDEFNRAVTEASDRVIGDLRLASERRSFPLRRVNADRYTRERCALIGDAAHIIHPLAGQGVNLGLLDAASLAEVFEWAIARGESPGAGIALRRYERWRKSENELMSFAMDGINRYLAFGGGAIGALAERGMSLIGRNATLRRPFALRALGLEGELPRFARRSA
jgi:2-octaprenylphenol hydroxylase